MDQLQCLGILQTCEVLKVGMPTRVTYTELKEVSIYIFFHSLKRGSLSLSLSLLPAAGLNNSNET